MIENGSRASDDTEKANAYGMTRSESEATSMGLRPTGEIDIYQKESFQKALEPLESVDIAVLDFSAVRYIDSSGLSCLIACRDQMLKNGRAGTIRIVNPTASVMRVLHVCGLDQVFDVVTSSETPPEHP